MPQTLTRTAENRPLPRPVQDHLGTLLRAMLDEDAEAVPGRLEALAAKVETVLAERRRNLDPALRDELLASLSPLRAYAVSLCGDRVRADDLVQEAIARALRNLDRFERGTNLQAWLFVILRNHFHSEWRRRTRETEDPDEVHARRLVTAPNQLGRIAVADLRTALSRIPAEQREALLLVAVEGLTYEEAAEACGVVVGTIKSRVSRARERLAEFLEVDDGMDLGLHRETRAITG